jgi:hypothetical protein
MISAGLPRKRAAGLAAAALAGLCALLPTSEGTAKGRERSGEEWVSRQAGVPLLAIVALREQHVTIYDAAGRLSRAPVSTGQSGYETPAGIYSVIQKEAEHFSNLYDDASMPFMQRITWSGIALHAGVLPGYPASHGCIRMPYAFAEHLFELTKLGMRVVVTPHDVAPLDIAHPALFQPKPLDSGLTASIPAASGAQPVALGGSTAHPPVALTLRALVEAKAAEASEATRRAEAARLAALRAAGDAMRSRRAVRMAETAVTRAAAQLKDAERTTENLPSPESVWLGEDLESAKNKLRANLTKAASALAAIQTEAEPLLEVAANLREAVKVAEAARLAAVAAAREAATRMAPISVFISRQAQRLYVRQAFQPLFESPVTISDGDRPIGTHVFTALDYVNDGAQLRWSAVSMAGGEQEGEHRRAEHRHGATDAATADLGAAKAALERIAIPQEARDRVSEVVSPGSSLVISDELLSKETSKGTEFVVLMSGEPQGGIRIRRHNPLAYPVGYGRYDGFMRAYGRGGSSWW